MDDTEMALIISAAQCGNIEALTMFLDEGKDYNVMDNEGWRPIHHAAYNGHFKCVKLILEKAKSDYKSGTEFTKKMLRPTIFLETPLALAAKEGHGDIVALLADVYIESNVEYEKMGLPLHQACRHGQKKCIEVLLTKLTEYSMQDNDLALLSAVHSENIEALKVLLDERSEDYNVKDADGWCLIHYASYNGLLESVKFIIERAKSDYKSVSEVIENVLKPTIYNETPLSLAAKKGHCEIVEFFSDLYIKSEVGTDYNMGFPLHVACKYGHNKCIEVLVRKLPQCIDMVKGPHLRKCPIHITVEEGNIEGTKILIQSGCDVNSRCHSNQTTLHLAVVNGNYELVQLLADKVGDLNTHDEGDNTPLFLASKNGNTDIVRCLLTNGSDASIPTSCGDYPEVSSSYLPIDIAAEFGHIEVLKLLSDCTPKYNKTPATFHAASHGKIDCLVHLLDKGFPTFDSDTKLHYENIWFIVMRECPSDVLAKIVKILLDEQTLFHSLVKSHSGVINANWKEIYFLPQVIAHADFDVLTQFLDAGILEIKFDCKSYPDMKCIIEKHLVLREIQDESDSDSDDEGELESRDVPRILKCLEYLPFLTWSHQNSSILPTQDNFGDGNLVENVPSLSSITRWTIRCLIIKNKGMIHRKYINSLKLPRKVSEFLKKC